VHLKNAGCRKAQLIRRTILKKHYMDIERKKMRDFKEKSRKNKVRGAVQARRRRNPVSPMARAPKVDVPETRPGVIQRSTAV